jgi:hypothetical protein
MNDSFGRGRSPRRPWLRRARVVAAMTALAGVTLLTAACGGGSSSTSAAVGSTTYQKALAYSQCMRSHGVLNFPDPDSQGHFNITASGQPGVSSAAAKQASLSAQNACRRLFPNGGQVTPAQQQQVLNQMLQYARCMRAHGLPKYPDPANSGGQVGFSLSAMSAAGIDPNSPQYRSASQACSSLRGRGA